MSVSFIPAAPGTFAVVRTPTTGQLYEKTHCVVIAWQIVPDPEDPHDSPFVYPIGVNGRLANVVSITNGGARG